MACFIDLKILFGQLVRKLAVILRLFVFRGQFQSGGTSVMLLLFPRAYYNLHILAIEPFQLHQFYL